MNSTVVRTSPQVTSKSRIKAAAKFHTQAKAKADVVPETPRLTMAERAKKIDWKYFRKLQKQRNRNGRPFAIGVLRPTGSLEKVVMDGLSEGEAEFLVQGTDLTVIAPERFTLEQMVLHWSSTPRKLHDRLYDYRVSHPAAVTER